MSPFVGCPYQYGQHWNRRHTDNKNILLFWEQPLCFICPFTKWVVTYFQCSVLWVIHTLHVSILSQVCSWQSFLSFSRLCFPSIASFAGQKLFKFHAIQLVTSCFHFRICETSFPKVLAQHHVLKYLPCLPLKVPRFRFNIKIFGPFWISFCMGWGILT